MQLYLAVTPEHVENALALTPHLAHAAFRVGAKGTLLSRTLPPRLRGGLAVIQCDTPFPESTVPLLSRDLLQLCLQRDFRGIVLDGFDRAVPSHRTLCRGLDALCQRYGRSLYVPPCCADDAPHAAVLVCTALSGGTQRALLEDAAQRFGAHRIALDLQRLMMEFSLPCLSGEGSPLSPQELQQRMAGRSVYYCSSLVSRYCTRSEGGSTKFILFDDADTLHRKMELAESMGITEGFLMWPEVCDIAGEFFYKKKEAEP